MFYILSFLFIIINFGLLLYYIGFEFISIWLQIIYGGSVIIFILITSMLCRIEYKNTILLSIYKNIFINLFLISFFLIAIYKLINFNLYWNIWLFNASQVKTFNSNLYYFLFITYGPLVLWIAILLMLIMIAVIEIQDYNRKK